MKVGFCGLGGMGAAMATRLLDRGHRVSVWNRTAAKTQPLVDQGAVRAATPASVAAGSGIVITCLFDDQAVADVYDGPNGLLTADCRGALFVETSTIRAETISDLADRVRGKRAGLRECPVAGAPAMARAGQLIGFAGGDDTDFARARPVLDDLCQRLDHFGPLGSGNAMKLAVNLPLLAYIEALGEALALARNVPVDPQKLVTALAESPGGANAMKIAGPWIVEALTSGREAAGLMSLAAVRKDLHLMIEAAERAGTEFPVASAALASFDDAVAAGWGERPFWTLSLYRRTARSD